MAAQIDIDVSIPAPNPDPEPEPELDPTSRTTAQILEVLPDIEPGYLIGLVQKHLWEFADQTAERVLEMLVDGGEEYPRRKGKRKARDVGVGNEGKNKMIKVDYASDERPVPDGRAYSVLALIELQNDFPLIPKPYLRQVLQRHRGLYAPTHLALATEDAKITGPRRAPRPYTLKSKEYKPVGKDQRSLRTKAGEAFWEEKRWLVQHLEEARSKGKERAVEDAVAPVELVECQCCFSEFARDKMVQCPEEHPFCSECVSQYASTKLGEHDPAIVCMHPSGCVQPFSASALRRVLSPTLMDLFERTTQLKEVDAAGLEGLEGCPFCDWKCVLEVSAEEDKLFRCGNEEGGCGVVSCRLCKRDEHLPKSCKEVDDELLFADSRLWFEEAMSRALMRNCPKCKKAFIKEWGCNCMACPKCYTKSCYVCRKAIAGHEHFDKSACPMHDDVEERHETEVKAAAEKALEEYKRDHPTVDEKSLDGVLKNIRKAGGRRK